MMVLDTALNIFALVAGGLMMELFASGWVKLHQKDLPKAPAAEIQTFEFSELATLENPS